MFKRKSWVTKGADPTTVVQWASDRISITEFQNVYEVQVQRQRAPFNRKPNAIEREMGEALHKALEDAHHFKENYASLERSMIETPRPSVDEVLSAVKPLAEKMAQEFKAEVIYDGNRSCYECGHTGSDVKQLVDAVLKLSAADEPVDIAGLERKAGWDWTP